MSSRRAEVLEMFAEAAQTPRQRPRAFDRGELAKVLPLRTSKADKEQERRERKRISDRKHLAKLKAERPEVYEARKAYRRAYHEKMKTEDPERLARHRANAKGSRKAWYARNKKKVIAQARAWEKAHPNDPKARARQKRMREKRKADPVRHAKRNAYAQAWSRAKRAARKAAGPTYYVTFRGLTEKQLKALLVAAEGILRP